MIKEIEIANVRVFGPKRTRFTLAPLTVLCGTNSAGKSTIAKMPLLLRQSHGIGEALESAAAQLRLVGSQTDLGTYRTFVHQNDSSIDAEIGITIEDVVSKALVANVRAWKRHGHAVAPQVAGSGADETSYTLNARFRFGLRSRPTTKRQKGTSPSSEITASDEPSGPAVIKRAVFELSIGKEKFIDWQLALVPEPAHTPIGQPRYQLVLPAFLLKVLGWYEHLDAREDDAGYAAVGANVTGILPTGLMVRLRGGPPKETRSARYSLWPLPVMINDATEDLQRALRGVHYLGPLRAPARRYYVAQSAIDPGMDASGEFLPYVLRDKAAQSVRYCAPGSLEPRSEPLAVALDNWLFYLRTGSSESPNAPAREIGIATTKDVLVEFSLRSIGGADSHALADSGFGYSQVLPIMVRGLLAEEDSTTIVEQPELHLNPALQVRLAEFFVGLARAGKQIVVETHSEHIVNAIRVVAAEGGRDAAQCRVYFLDAINGTPEVHELHIGDDGTLDHWPRNFFGETANLRARLLRAQKKFLKTHPSDAE
jgi:predicted ATPase